jgi:hypothetical protein
LGGDGLSWNTAHRYLQDGLESARAHLDEFQNNTVEIWVAAGTYRPDQAEGNVDGAPVILNRRTETFTLRNQVRIYGGFVGGTNGETDKSQRNYKANVTILSGEIGDPNELTDNTFHIVTGHNIRESAILDGFTITRGYASNLSGPIPCVAPAAGGGMLLYQTLGLPALQPVILRCKFIDNYANQGAAVYIHGIEGNPRFRNG